MTSNFAVPQFGQVIVDRKITRVGLRIEVPEHDQDTSGD
jgi:hypothetical protein